MSTDIRISFGALSSTLDEQLREQGLKLNMDPVMRVHLQRDVDEVIRQLLHVRGIVTEAESDRAFKRIFQTIKKHAKPL